MTKFRKFTTTTSKFLYDHPFFYLGLSISGIGVVLIVIGVYQALHFNPILLWSILGTLLVGFGLLLVLGSPNGS